MSGQNEYLCYLHMLWRVGGIYGDIGYIVARKGLDALIDIGCTIVVAMETDIAEVGLHKSRLQISHPDGGVGHIDTQASERALTAAFVAQYTLPPA